MACVVSYVPDHPFPIQNLPYGAFVQGTSAPRLGVAIGDYILDLASQRRRPLCSPKMLRLRSANRR
jgi:hypothetical protein